MFFDPPTEPEVPKEPTGSDPCGYFPMRLEPGYLTKIEQGQAVVRQLPDENWSDELIPHHEFLSPLEHNVIQRLSDTLNRKHLHHLVPQVVDHLHRDSPRLRFLEGTGSVAVERFPGVGVDFCLERGL